MTDRDENDLSDEELLEMWQQGEPVDVRTTRSPAATDTDGRTKPEESLPKPPRAPRTPN